MYKTIHFRRYLFTNIVLFLSCIAFSQNDTLNRRTSNGKKHGYWVCYLDKKFSRVDPARASYRAYELFDEGEALTRFTFGEFANLEVKADTASVRTNKTGLLDGVYVASSSKSSTKCIYTFKNGYPLTLKAYRIGKTPTELCLIRQVDYSKRHQNEIGTFYWEERSCNTLDSTSYWFRKVNGKWISIQPQENLQKSTPDKRDNLPYPNNYFDIGVGVGPLYGIVGANVLIGYKATGLILAAGLAGYGVYIQVGYEAVFLSFGRAVIGTQTDLNTMVTKPNYGNVIMVGGKINLVRSKTAYLLLSAGFQKSEITLRTGTKFESINTSGPVGSIGFGFRIPSKF